MPLVLHDVADAERFTGDIASRCGRSLSHHDRADLEQFLLAECWRLSTRFEPGRSTISFSTYAGSTLRLRITDWQRQRFGRTKWKFAGHVYERPRPEFVRLDDGVIAAAGDAVAARGGDSPADWDSLVGGLFRDRDRARARDLELLDLASPR